MSGAGGDAGAATGGESGAAVTGVRRGGPLALVAVCFRALCSCRCSFTTSGTANAFATLRPTRLNAPRLDDDLNALSAVRGRRSLASGVAAGSAPLLPSAPSFDLLFSI